MTATDGPIDHLTEVVVVGRGLIGAASARHLAEAGCQVVVIGPDEPADRRSWTGPFSSHGDEGRITRIIDADPVWADLAHRSIERYADIETRSGVAFHDPCGLVVSTSDLDRWSSTGRSAGAALETVDPERLTETTGLRLPAGPPVVFEGPPAGLVNPRRLVEAQTVLARRAGATVVPETVTTLRPLVDGVEVGGPWGAVRADRVLVTTGAFGRDLIGRQLPVVRRPRTVLLAELAPSGTETAPLPSLILRPPTDDRLDALYWVPPVLYPDGRRYLKVGGSMASNPEFSDDPQGDTALTDWFHGSGDPAEAAALRNCLDDLLPTMTVRTASTVPCVYTGTPSGYPTIDWLEPRVAVAIGGNGSGAKCSDELGRLGATLVADRDLGPGPDPAIFGRLAR